jgi:hypothetical protein
MSEERVIYKYAIPINAGTHFVSVPGGSEAEFCMAEIIDESFVVWFAVDPEDKPETCRMIVIGTGQRFPENWAYIASARGGQYVWHLLEKYDE